jgi:hypothetical protein
MARSLGEDAPAPSQPPLIGTDTTPWMTAEQIQAALAPPAADGRIDAGGGPAPIDMNVNQFLSLDRPTQNQILATWGGMGAMMPINGAADPNDPAHAGNLPSKLWYAAPESSRARFLEGNPAFPDVDFATAMLGPLTQPRNVGGGPSPSIPWGQGEWQQIPSESAHPLSQGSACTLAASGDAALAACRCRSCNCRHRGWCADAAVFGRQRAV